MTIWIMRHGEAIGDEPQSPLSPQGIQQAYDAVRKLHKAGIRPDRVISGVTARSYLTAAVVGPGLGAQWSVLDAFSSIEFSRMELNREELGEWERILTGAPVESDRLRFEIGTRSQVVVDGFQFILEQFPRENILIVSHCGVMCTLKALLERGDPWQQFAYPLADHCEVWTLLES
jgi:broad specificity phosphatase PhoE